MLIWSERRGPRLREMAADSATLVWLTLWLTLGLRLYERLAELAGAGREVRAGGLELIAAGERLGEVLQGVPFIGEAAAERIRDAFGASAQPVIRFGSELEQLLLTIAALLGLIVVALALVPWLTRYVPWRMARLRRLNAAARVIRGGELVFSVQGGEHPLERLLASRAIHRLPYERLLEFTSDPFGDWQAGRLERLVQAELEEVGLGRVG